MISALSKNMRTFIENNQKYTVHVVFILSHWSINGEIRKDILLYCPSWVLSWLPIQNEAVLLLKIIPLQAHYLYREVQVSWLYQ